MCSLICLFCACQIENKEKERPINSELFGYLKKTCIEQDSCEVKLDKIIESSWDKFYVFDFSVEDQVISKEIGTQFSSTSPYYSSKWFFIKDGHITHFEQRIIPEVDKPNKNGDIDFEIRNSQNKFSVFEKDSLFKAEKHKLTDGDFYELKCLNCK